MFKVLQTTTTDKSCTITALFESFYIIAFNIDTQAHISYTKIKTLEIMKNFIISEDILSKVKGLLKAGQVNVVIQCHEKHGIINQLNNLKELPMEQEQSKRNKRKCFYRIHYTGTNPITDNELTNEVLHESEYQLTEQEIRHAIWETFELSNIKLVIREIQKEEFDLIKEDIFLLSDY